MGLSRLDNFLKSVRGTILYVDPSSLDSTDNIENQGNSLTRPFKTIQRALIESARFSYQIGLDNDRFDKTTILVYPGDHIVDNRPGWIPDGANNYRLRGGETSNDFPPFDLTTTFDLSSPDNQLYKLNSIHGGVIIPRGTSLVGLDLRKTKIRPKYVPNPTNDNIERSCIFRVTGTCYFWQFSLFDADPNGQCYTDYTDNLFVPNFSHHKLSCFEYADGVNDVSISDAFQTYSTDRTDLEMYYEKVGLAYGQASGRQIQPDYPSSGLDIQPKIGEYRIVGPTGGNIGITSIRAGNGITPTTTITATLESITGLDVDTAFRINNVSDNDYNGEFVVTSVPATNQITYQVQNAPINALPSVTGASLFLKTDTVASASPYIFNVSLRSVYGMCGVLSDGDKATGFKSMVLAQFTGISLQKDDRAFVLYNTTTGQYTDSTVPGNENLSINSRAVYKPAYESFHIRTINDAYIQNVSIFAIGFHSHFNAESGGDQSINNSNSNFGSKSLLATGFKRNAFPRDDVGYITHVIPPREIETLEGTIEFIGIDVAKTVGVASTSRLYLYNETNASTPPQNVLQGYRVGAKTDDTLNVLISNSGSSQEYSANIVMPDTQGTANETIAIKSFQVAQSIAGVSSITSNVFTLTQPHTFIEGESVRVKSFTGNLPDGIISNITYYAITSGTGITSTTQIKLAKTPNDAINDTPISVNNKGGILTIESRVVDKTPGSFGHPIQYDTSQNNWYINVSAASTQNSIYSTIVSLGTTALGASTPRTYLYRKVDPRSVLDTIYRLRYVIPASAGVTSARPPLDGFIIQESSTTIGSSDAEVAKAFSPTTVSISNENEIRNFRIISNASWDGTYAYFDTELPHELSIGSQVSILNVVSSANTAGTVNSGFNFGYSVVGISTITTIQNHGLSVGNKITIGGANSSLFNSDFLVKKVNSLVQFETFVGIGTTSPATTGTKTIYIKAFGSQGGTVTTEDENIAGRLEPQYAGITTTLSSAINTATVDNFNIQNITSLDLNIGDYLLIDSEIMRIKTTVTGNPVYVFRGIYGTDASTHNNGSVVRRIKLRPIELRRHSIIRASGHTFEYVGFGPGNYSTAFPDRQDRVLSDQEEILSQSTKVDGGLVVFTGMNDRGAFYVGNKKVNSATGQEQVFDSPIPTVTGEDILSAVSIGFDALTPLEISVSRSIRVEGGTDGKLISEFDGPVIFNQKITSNAPDGIEANSIFLQGDATVSRKYTVGVTQPTVSGNPGDIAYYTDPNRGGYVGWIYTLENDWYRFGNISISETENHMIFDRVGIATTSAGTDTFRIGAGSSLFSVNATGGVGIGTTANTFKLNVNGNTNIGGTITASYFSGDGSSLVNLNAAALGWTQITGGIYNTALNNVGIGTSVP
ncbi:hypothetical protein EB118_16235, partial [bacterium]|nr:hypothetical protein [bacterium]